MFKQNENPLSPEEIETILKTGLENIPFDRERVLVIIPDHTRSMPQALFFRLLIKYLTPRVKSLDFMIALGTHPPMPEAAILNMLGISAHEKNTRLREIHIFNHAWDHPESLATIGVLSAGEIDHLSQGLIHEDVPIRLNQKILKYDHLLVCGPVFPHEVVGFSGGNKYFFPGIGGPDIINVTHWLGALNTSYQTIGKIDTPIREIIDRAASFIPVPRHAICLVVEAKEHAGVEEAAVAGIFIGTPEEAYRQAAILSSERHIIWCDHPFKRVVSIMPEMYDELWVGAKGMYKVEPVVADDGEVIIYAPHIKEISVVHGAILRQIGYHVRDYFVKQWDLYKQYPWSVLAHSTHLRGMGSYVDGIERARIRVTLATGIPRSICEEVNLGYYDPASIQPMDWVGREQEGILVVPHAGEDLYRLKGEKNL